ncbi:calcium channel-related [Klebsormidium nitens]|uniref:Calcium channel-related n=1 Tax=Klebsormidium nitens TaxID=105231 RepID=A0A0U9HHH3_KLENI|nr:calcium channel-related [Klebsormidium nitens]|eukprot:GAQ77572.1 calcium channel-related [Klebsormidium nitens]
MALSEEPLLGDARPASSSEGISAAGPTAPARHGQKRGFRMRNAAGRAQASKGRRKSGLSSADRVERAAALVDLAEDGIGLPIELLDSTHFSRSAKRYFWCGALAPIWTANFCLLLGLNFVEVPSWCAEPFPHPCGDPKKYWLGGFPYLPPKSFNALELVSLCVLAFQVFLPISFEGHRHFWRDRLNQLFILLFSLLAADVLVNTAWLYTDVRILDKLVAVRLAPYLRVLVVGANGGETRKAFRILIGIIPAFLDMMTLIGFWLAFSAWLLYILFEHTTQGEKYFKSWRATLNELIIGMFTAQNLPDFWMPAFNDNRAAGLIFMTFEFVSCNFFLSLIFAVVYDGYKNSLAKEYKKAYLARNKILQAAFQTLDERKRGYLDSHQISKLLIALNQYRNFPHFDEADIEHIFLALDDSGDNRITEEEFLDMCVAVRLRFVPLDEPTLLEVFFPDVFTSARYDAFKDFVRSRAFQHIVHAVLVLQALVIMIESAADVTGDQRLQAQWLRIEMGFGLLYLAEMLAKIMAEGARHYWRTAANKFDCLVTLGIVVTQVLIVAGLVQPEWIRYLLILCVLRLARVLTSVKRYSVIMTSFFSLWRVVTPLVGVTYCFSSIFCSMGIQLFGGEVYDGAPCIKGTGYEDSGYGPNNFNDYASGMVLIFEWLNSSLFSVWLTIAGRIYDTAWIRVYFISFLILGTIFIMNVFIGFVFDAYYVETELAESGGNELRDLRLGFRGKAVEVEPSDRFQQVMDHMLGGNELRQLSLQESLRRRGQPGDLESRGSLLAKEIEALR